MIGNNQYLNPWTEREIEILKYYYRGLCNYELSKYLNNRSPGAVKRKLRSLGLKRDEESMKYIRSKITSGENNGMYGKKRPQWLKDKLHNLKFGKKFSEETISKRRDTRIINHLMGKTKIVGSNLGKKFTIEHRKKISKALKGKKKSKQAIENSRFSLKEGYHKGTIISSWLGKKNPQLTKRNLDPEFQKKARLAQDIRPNKPEQIMINLIKENNLPFNYVGDGKIWIKGEKNCFNPDFLSKNPKHIIEVFGDYWHNREDSKKRDIERLATYEKYGYKTLIIWEHELKEPMNVLNKIKEFITTTN